AHGYEADALAHALQPSRRRGPPARAKLTHHRPEHRGRIADHVLGPEDDQSPPRACDEPTPPAVMRDVLSGAVELDAVILGSDSELLETEIQIDRSAGRQPDRLLGTGPRKLGVEHHAAAP